MIAVELEHVFAPVGQPLHVKVFESKYVPSWQDEHFVIEFTTVQRRHLSLHKRHFADESI